MLKRTVLFGFRTHSKVLTHLRNGQPRAQKLIAASPTAASRGPRVAWEEGRERKEKRLAKAWWGESYGENSEDFSGKGEGKTETWLSGV